MRNGLPPLPPPASLAVEGRARADAGAPRRSGDTPGPGPRRTPGQFLELEVDHRCQDEAADQERHGRCPESWCVRANPFGNSPSSAMTMGSLDWPRIVTIRRHVLLTSPPAAMAMREPAPRAPARRRRNTATSFHLRGPGRNGHWNEWRMSYFSVAAQALGGRLSAWPWRREGSSAARAS